MNKTSRTMNTRPLELLFHKYPTINIPLGILFPKTLPVQET